MIHFREGCIGITLFKWGAIKLEMWFAGKNTTCREHVHNDSDSEITILYAKPRRIWRRSQIKFKLTGSSLIGQDNADFNKEAGTIYIPNEEYIASSKKHRGQWFSVRAGVPHGFDKGESFMIFLNLQHYLKGRPVTSVAEDFQLTT